MCSQTRHAKVDSVLDIKAETGLDEGLKGTKGKRKGKAKVKQSAEELIATIRADTKEVSLRFCFPGNYCLSL